MLDVVNSWHNAASLEYAIVSKERKKKELIQARIDLMHRQKGDHPRYAKMTDKEFHDYKVENHRWFSKRIQELEAEISQLEKLRETI